MAVKNAVGNHSHRRWARSQYSRAETKHVRPPLKPLVSHCQREEEEGWVPRPCVLGLWKGTLLSEPLG